MTSYFMKSPFRSIVHLLVLLPLLLIPSTASKDLKIGAFNVQVFGRSKMSKPVVVRKLVSTLQRWDLVLVQEVRDTSETAIHDLLSLLNKPDAANGAYSLLLSSKLGRTNSKEQLAWFYRPAKITYLREHQIPDPEDHWQRPPQVTYWDITGGNGLPENTVGIIGIHVDPGEAVAEIDQLATVVDGVVAAGEAKYGVWVMGDLNADCSYISKTKWRCIRDPTCTTTKMSLYNPTKYQWFIDDDADTTTSATHCAYDRFVFAKPVPENVSNVGVYDFGKGMSVADVKLVSDHYPIEFTLSVPDSGTGAEGAAPSSSRGGGGSGGSSGESGGSSGSGGSGGSSGSSGESGGSGGSGGSGTDAKTSGGNAVAGTPSTAADSPSPSSSAPPVAVKPFYLEPVVVAFLYGAGLVVVAFLCGVGLTGLASLGCACVYSRRRRSSSSSKRGERSRHHHQLEEVTPMSSDDSCIKKWTVHQTHIDGNDYEYYYNEETRRTTWTDRRNEDLQRVEATDVVTVVHV